MADRITGKVTRLYPTEGKTYIRLDKDWEKEGPKDGYFVLNRDHDNYEALYSLALAAAINRLPLKIRADTRPPNPPAITINDHAPVVYMVVEWAD